MTAGATSKCPSCASTYIERMPVVLPRDEGDGLTVEAAPTAEEPPNMRCNACGHTWWAPMDPRR